MAEDQGTSGRASNLLGADSPSLCTLSDPPLLPASLGVQSGLPTPGPNAYISPRYVSPVIPLGVFELLTLFNSMQRSPLPVTGPRWDKPCPFDAPDQ